MRDQVVRWEEIMTLQWKSLKLTLSLTPNHLRPVCRQSLLGNTAILPRALYEDLLALTESIGKTDLLLLGRIL